MNKEEIKDKLLDKIKEMILEEVGDDKFKLFLEAIGEEEKEFPQEGDMAFYIDENGDVLAGFYSTMTKAMIENGNYYKTEEEAEAVRDLRKHEAKCRYDMYSFTDGYWTLMHDFESFKACQPSELCVISGRAFKTEEEAQERADILKRLAKIRGLI